MTQLKFEIFHDGINGIKKVKALIEMTNFSARLNQANSSIVVTQTFGYSHYWLKENLTIVSARSGNPGYLHSKPILTGIVALKDPESLQDEKMKESDLVIDRGNEEMSQFLTVMVTDCTSFKR